jgi:hypothetical protein
MTETMRTYCTIQLHIGSWGVRAPDVDGTEVDCKRVTERSEGISKDRSLI